MFQGANAYHNQYVMNNCSGIIHVVKERDTLYKIGQMYGVSVSALMYANPYVNVYNLQIGDELCVPVYSMSGNMQKEQTNMQPTGTPAAGNQMPEQEMPNQRALEQGTSDQRMMQQGTLENRMGVQTENRQPENDMSDVMKIQESRLEYEISDDSEL